MAPRSEHLGSLKRGRANADYHELDVKKPRRSQRISSKTEAPRTPVVESYLPTPLTNPTSVLTSVRDDSTATPPDASSQRLHGTLSEPEPFKAFSSPPSDTQRLSQYVYPPRPFAGKVKDEAAEGVWGYLIPLDDRAAGDVIVLRKCDGREDGSNEKKFEGSVPQSDKDTAGKKVKDRTSPSGYLVGRHPECDLTIDIPTISNRHFLLFPEYKSGGLVAILEDLSSNGTFVNDAIVGRNKHRELEDGDEVAVLHEATFAFRYPRTREASDFRQQYRILKQLGKGHFATVYLCVHRTTAARYAVKVFEKHTFDSQKSQTDVLQQETALLMGISHPNLLCLKDTFDEIDGAYLVLEFAPEGELFNLVVSKNKLSEDEARYVLLQLLEGLKYLHDRGIIHRDIKPENILLTDKKLSLKLGDFGLAKIIGEDSFTTTLCGTPSYVAPEVLQDSNHRRYTNAVDIWSLGVVLYICLCGFPPFSDELCTRENPYTLAQQIKTGRFDYPSPYWDSVGDPALDLIDKMLTVDVNKRITVDQCLEHPWLTGKYPSVTDSTDGLTGAMGGLDFSKRKVERERTLLSSINDIHVSEHMEDDGIPVKVFHKAKAKAGKPVDNCPGETKEFRDCDDLPDHTVDNFTNFGERGDPVLFESGPTGRRK